MGPSPTGPFKALPFNFEQQPVQKYGLANAVVSMEASRYSLGMPVRGPAGGTGPVTGAPAARVAGTGAYGLGAVSIGTLSTAPAVLLLYYLTQTLGLPPLWASLILIAPKGLAMAWDPLVGRALDSLGDAPRRRLATYLAGLVLAGLGLALALAPPSLPPPALAAYVAVAYALHVAGYSVLSISHVAVTAALPMEEAERMRWSAVRTRMVLAGVIGGAGLAPLALAALGGGREGYAALGLGLAVVCLALGAAPLIGARRALSSPTLCSVRVRPDGELARLLGVYLAITIASGAGSAAAPLWTARWLGRPAGDAGVLLLILLIVAAAAVPLWRALALRIGAARALGVAALAYGAGLFLVTALVGVRSWPAIAAGFAVLGLAFGGLQILPFTLIASAIRRQALAGGPGEGAASGVWAAVEQAGLGAGPALTGLVLALTGGRVDMGFVLAISCLSALLMTPALAAGRVRRSPVAPAPAPGE